MKHAYALHLIGLLSIVIGLFQPFDDGTPPSEPEAPTTGDLVVSLVGSDGAALGGACVNIYDSSGATTSPCADGSGTAVAYGLPAGSVTVSQISGPASYALAPDGYGDVPAGGTGYVTLTAAYIPPPPTPTPEPTVAPPTEEPTLAPTEEPTLAPTEEPTVAPTDEAPGTPAESATEAPEVSSDDSLIQPLAAGDVSIACQHDPGSTTSSFAISADDIPGDVQPFTIIVTPYDLQGNPLPTQEFTSAPVILEDEEWRSIDIEVQFSDGTSATASGGCNTDAVDTSVSTQAKTADGTDIPDGGWVEQGTTIYDTATLGGNTVDAGGTVTYSLYRVDQAGDCSGTPVFTDEEPVTNGVVPDSATHTPTEPGTYEWVVSYSGDSLNNASQSACGAETVQIGQVPTDVTTTMKSETGDGVTIPQGGSVGVGEPVFDTATITGGTGDATGTVTYELYSGECPGTLVNSWTVDVTGGVVPPSPPVEDLPFGTYNWVVSYSGDDQHAPSTSGCGEETFTVDKAQPTITTNMFNDETDVEILDGSTVPVGTSSYDTTTISGATDDVSGTVTYSLYFSADGSDTCDAGNLVFSTDVTIADGAVPPSPPFTFDQTGTWNWQVSYSGDDNNESATSDCGSETVNIEPASPDITTEIHNADDDSVVPVGSSLPADSSVYDTADLSGATDDATGTVTYTLYNNFTCTGDPYYQVTLPLNEDGTVPPTPDVGPLPGGTWNWTASYSGDDNNNPASTSCGDEEFFIGQGQGGISTLVEDEGGTTYPDGSEVEVGAVLRDTAVLDGVTPDAGGTVTFYLYEGADCSSDPVFVSDPVDVVNGELAGPSDTYTFDAQGTYQWVAEYSGDENNAPVSSPCGAETIVVVGQPTSVTTTMFQGNPGVELANNDRVLEGTPVYDTAAVTPDTATGTLTYTLYNSANCSGDPVYQATVNVGEPSEPVTLDTPGTYNWVVSYSGDATFAPSESGCSAETFYIALQPSVVTTMVDENGDEIINNSTIQAGDSIGDTAVLEGATASASGTVTYSFYNNADCSGTAVFASTVTVTNAVVPPSGLVQPPLVGEWSIQAVYSGDNTNFPATSDCGTENFTVDPNSNPTVTTTMRANDEVLPHQGEIRFLPASVNDTLNIFGVVPGSTGEVNFMLYQSTDCSEGSLVFTDTQTVEINATNLTVTSNSYNIPEEDWGNYNWVVTWEGDLDGDGQPESLESGCGEESFLGVTQNEQNITIGCTYDPDSDTSSFRVIAAKPTTADPDEDPNLVIVASPLDNTLEPVAPITYDWYDSNNAPDPPVDFSDQPWRQLDVVVTWPDGQTANATANCNGNPFTPELTTAMFEVPDTALANGTVLDPGAQVYDTAVLSDSTVRWSGDLTYTLYQSDDCAPGTEVGDPQVFILDPANTELPASNAVTASLPGTYNWVVEFSGDDNNEPATSPCGDEFFVVEPFDVTVLTQVMLADGTTEVPDDGTVPFGTSVIDTTVLEGATDAVTGTVTYTLYATGDCSDDPVFTEVVQITNGSVPPSSPVALDQAVTYNWVVSYSGDDIHAAGTSACGDETVLVEQAAPSITTLLSTEEASAGDEVYDTAILSGASDDASGTVTYNVYTTDDCSGDPLYTLGPVDVANGVVPDSPPQIFDTPGHYEWQAVYSGDANNEPATSECGTEPLDILAPDILVEKTAGTLLVAAGDDISFTITVSNVGQGDAYDVVVSDDLPEGIEWTIDPAVDGCSIADGTLTCTIDTLPAGESATITVVGATDAADCGFITNEASASAGNEPDTVLDNNSDGATLRVNCPNIRVLKTTDTPSVSAGDTASFTIEVRNVGLGRADNVTMSDQLPADIDWAIDSSSDGWDCAIDGSELLTCDATEPLTFGSAFTVTVSGEVLSEDCGIITNEATAEAANESDATLANNVDSVQIQVLCPELVVLKTTSTGVVSAGDDVSYTITAINLGAGTAYNVGVTDELPAGIDWTIDPAVDECNIEPGIGLLTCFFGTLEPETSASVTVVGTTDAVDCRVLTNRAIIESSNEPGGGGFIRNFSREVDIDVLCPDLEVEKTSSNSPVSAGEPLSFTITVTNVGEGTAYDVEVTDDLPDGIEWTIDPAVEGCEISGGQLDCTFDELAGSTSQSVTVTGLTDPADCGAIVNTVQGSASNEDQDALADNTATATANVLCPDIAVEKTASSGIISAGDEASFTVTVSNIGQGVAFGVELSDELPEGVVWTIDPEVEGCEIADGVLTCDIGTLPAGESVSVTVTGTTAADDCGVLANMASATASNESSGGDDNEPTDGTRTTRGFLQADPSVLDNNEATAEITVLCPDIAVDKTTSTGVVSAGDEASFTITVTNFGEGNAYGVQLTDTLPEGIEWTIDPAVESCSITDGTLTCDIGTLEPNEGFSVTVTGITDAADCGIVPNQANGTATNEAEGDSGNNEGTAEITVLCPDIEVLKSAANTPVSAGDEVSYTITVTNLGEGNAYDVVVTDELPEGIEWTIDPEVEGCSIADGILTCDFGTMDPQETIDVTVTGTTDAADCGVVTNTANADASNEADGDTGNNEASADIEVLCPDVMVEKTTSTGIVSAGDDVSFTVIISNTGEGDADNVVVTDELPAGVDWTIDPAVEGCSIAGSTLTCDLGTMEPGESVVVTLTGTSDATDCGVLANTASADATNESDGDTANNEATAEITVLCPDINVTKSAANTPVSAGDDVSFTITVANTGEGDAYDVTMQDQLPSDVEWTIDPEVDGCSITDGLLSCDFGTLASGESVDVTVVGTTDAADCGLLVNLAQGNASNESDDDQANNRGGSVIRVLCPDVEVLKTASNGAISAGDDASFTITVTNVGAGDAYNVQLTDMLPEGIDWTIDPEVEGCAITNGVLDCDIGTLPEGESFSVTVTGTTDAADCGVVANTASADASNEAEDDSANNTSSASIEVLCPDIEVLKSAANTPVSAGDEVSFTITVTNLGAGNAYDVVVTDELPAGIEWTIDPAVESCSIADSILTCEFATMAPQESIDITITGTSDAADCGVVANTASGTASNEAEDDTGNNEANAEVTVLCPDVVVEKTSDDADITAGDETSFTITVTNIGEGNAYNIMVTDELPAGFNWTAVPADDATTCEAADGAMVCTIPVLGPGESTTIAVSAPSTTSNCGTVHNEVAANAGNEPDDATDNNTSSADITIVCPPPPTPDTPDTPATPIHTLPVTGDGDSAGGSMVALWAQVAAAMLLMAAAGSVGLGLNRRRERS